MRQLFGADLTALVPLKIAWQRWLPMCCVAVALLLVPFGAMQRDLWTDEAYTVSYTLHPTIPAVLEDVRKNEETPPISFVLIWLWSQMVGQTEVAIRLFALLCGALSVLLFAWFVQHRLAPSEAWIAGMLLALAPLSASYLVEARGYTLTLLLTVACIWAFERLHSDPERTWSYVLYAGLAAALFLISYFGVALLLAHNFLWLALLLRQRALWRRRFVCWSMAQLFVGALVLPWLPALLYQMQVSPAVTSAWANGLRDYYILALSLLMNVPPRTSWVALWFPLAALSWGLIVVSMLRSRQQDAGLVLRTFGVPALGLLALILWMQVVAPRYLIILLPGAAVAIACGVRAVRLRWPRVAMALLAGLLSGLVAYRVPTSIYTEPVKPWSALASEVELQADPTRDVVLFHPPWDQRIFEYYYHGPALPLLGAHHYDDFYYVDRSHDLRTTWTSAQAQAVTHNYRRVWIFYDQMFHTVPRLKLPYIEVGHWQSDRLELFLYEVPAGS